MVKEGLNPLASLKHCLCFELITSPEAGWVCGQEARRGLEQAWKSRAAGVSGCLFGVLGCQYGAVWVHCQAGDVSSLKWPLPVCLTCPRAQTWALGSI